MKPGTQFCIYAIVGKGSFVSAIALHREKTDNGSRQLFSHELGIYFRNSSMGAEWTSLMNKQEAARLEREGHMVVT